MYAEEEKKIKKIFKFIPIIIIIVVLVCLYLFWPHSLTKNKSNDFENKILLDAKRFASVKSLSGKVFISLADIEDALGTSYDTCNKSTGIEFNNGNFDLYVICSKYISPKVEEINNKTYNNITLREDAFLITNNNKYIEPGYVSNYKVDVNSIKDYPKQGIYQTTYYVKDSSGNVIEVANRYTLYSNYNNDLSKTTMTLNGEKEIYIKKNSNFVDPGVTIIDANGNDLSKNVMVTGTVNTSVAGTYNLTYTLSQFTLTRKVIVTSIDYNAYLSTTDYTKSSVKIIINVNSSDFERLVLPDSSSVYKSHYEYEVFSNGIYKFNIITKNSGILEIVKEVSKIDKDKPKVKCTGKTENKVTAIYVEATDNSGIKYYKYGSYSGNVTTSSYAINQTVTALWVTVADNAGNITEASCQIEVVKPKQEETTQTHEPVSPSGNYKMIRLTHFDDAGLAKCGSSCVQNKINSGEIKTDEHGWYMYKYNDKWYYVVATAINNPSLIAKYGHESYTDIKYYNYYDTFKMYISDTSSSSTPDSRYKSYDVIVLDVCGACLKFSTKLQDIHPGWSTATIEKWRSDAYKGNSIKIDLWTTSKATNPADWAFIDG